MILCKTFQIKKSILIGLLILLSITLVLILAGNLYAEKPESSGSKGDLYINLQFHLPGVTGGNISNITENISSIVSDLNEYYLLRGVIFDYEINQIDNSIQTETEFSTYLNNKKPANNSADASCNIFVVGTNSTDTKSDAKLIKSDYTVMNLGSKVLSNRSILTEKLSQNIALWYTIKNTLKYNLLSGSMGSNTTFESKALADINRDGIGPDISDLVYMVNYVNGTSLFKDNNQVELYDISDVIELVEYLFNR